MGLCREKIVVLLLAVAVCSGAGSVCAAGESSDEGKGGSLFGNSSFVYGGDPNFAVGSDNGAGAGELFFKMMLMVGLVIVMGAAAIYLSRKLLPRFGQLTGKKIRVVETVHLGPRKTVHLLEIGDRQFLIGSTNENITRLADVTVALSEEDSPVGQIDN